MRITSLRGLSIVLIVIGVLASLTVAFDRWRFEAANRSVEITVDEQDLADFAHAYGYNEDELLREMRRSGLTSVAVYAEQGQHVNQSTHAYVQTGQQLIDAAHLTGLRDRGLAELVTRHEVDAQNIYLVVYDEATLRRYLRALRTQLESTSVRVLRPALPAIVAVRTQIDFFNSMDLGIPEDLTARVRALGLLVDPRVQNNERLSADGINAVFAQMLQGGRVGTVIFYGQRNEVLGYPYQLDATAAAFRAHRGVNFGDVEAYSEDQIQKGTQTLGRDVVSQTVRLMAIPKLQLDKLDVNTVVAEYLLGARERNIRVIYFRPYPHVIPANGDPKSTQILSAEQTNLFVLSKLSSALQANGFSIGRAAGFTDFKGWKLDVAYVLAGLGAAGAGYLLLDLLGWSSVWLLWTFVGLAVALFAAGFATGHAEAVRKLCALSASLDFGTMSAMTLATVGNGRTGDWRADAWQGLRLLALAAGVAVLGGLFITGLLSQAAFMIEIEQFFGVKALLVVPPLAAVAIYVFTPIFGARQKFADVVSAPVRVWALGALVVLAAAAVVLVMRSGNQPDVGASGFELNVRGALTTLMGARPRFKEFLIGYPAIFLFAALSVEHRRAAGWILVLAAAIGLADVLDTFSHVHTPLLVGLLRTFNGALVGAVIGMAFQWVYRRFAARKVSRGAA